MPFARTDSVRNQRTGEELTAPAGIRALEVSVGTALMHGLRMAAAVCLALLIAFWLQLDNAYWAGTSACIVAQPALGASLLRGRFRAIGTVVGGVAIVALTAVFPQDRLAFLTGLTLWMGICGFLATSFVRSSWYGAALAGLTAAVIFDDTAARPQTVFMLAVWRTTEIGIGIFSVAVVHSLTEFGSAHHRFGRMLSAIARGIAAGVSETLRLGNETLQLRSSRRQLIGRVIALGATIDEAIAESAHLSHERGRLKSAADALFVALSDWRGLGDHVGTASHPGAESSSTVLPYFARLADRDWVTEPEEARALCEEGSRLVRGLHAVDLSSRLRVDRVYQVFRALQSAAIALVVLTRPSDKPYKGKAAPIYVPDYLPGIVSALRIVIAIGSAELFWIATAWPDGPTMITFTAIPVIQYARQAHAAYSSSLDFAAGCIISGLLATTLMLLVLPSMHGDFVELSVVLSLMFVPLAALAARARHRLIFVAAFTFLLPIAAIENETTYNATRLLNTALAVTGGAAVGVMFFRLIPPLTPQYRARRLLGLSLRDLRELARGHRCVSKEAWLGLLTARLAALPEQATEEQAAELLVTLSVGDAAIALLALRGAEDKPLRRALAYVSDAKVAEAHEAFVRFASEQSPTREGSRGADAAVEATLIADALQRHPRFFSMAG
jgi:uncharacterized membrane protein YccC